VVDVDVDGCGVFVKPEKRNFNIVYMISLH